MTQDPHAAAAPDAVVDHATDDHGDTHGDDEAHGDGDHGHGEGEPLGPIDTLAWGAGALGLVLGLAVAVCFVLATAPVS